MTATRSPRILAANDHRSRGGGCILFRYSYPPEGLPFRGVRPPISHLEVRHAFRR
ncbi:hypothetical protein XCCB100_2454 [Xanthomonas campestris pv. campestris]|uniref:Uncharacterized protein n=1 Tax=Xanthomonas campestris pv. campestris (strain B100) TaxID=509169 RepID=B0RTQ0_XANCB|nr:hypothetical protein XCCB100_2454 [Xanthomonas campestris pv. campestris]